MKGSLVLAGFVAAGSLASCVQVARSSSDGTPLVVETRSGFAGARSDSVGAVESDWIRGFGDPRLEALVAEAIEHNAELELAAARVARANALARRAHASLLPTLDVFAGAARGDSGLGEGSRLDLGLAASWEADLWGRLSHAERAAELDAESARADWLGARNALAAETARGWFLALAAARRVEIDERSLAQRERVERITRARLDAGEAASAEVDLAIGTRASALALAEQSRGARRSSLLSLETLLGRYPAGELELAGDLPPSTADAPLGLPSELLERRPDVVAAQRAIAASFERVAAADAARLPRITLSAQGGYANSELSGLIDESNLIWNLASGIVAPLFDGGRLLADAEAARADRRAALAGWVATARNAFLEVETALNDEAALRKLEAALAESVERLTRARALAEDRYAEGEATLLELDQIHEQLYQSERGRLDARLALVLARVRLHLALGGAFQTRS
ncbi:MAG: efflux transporter outer membrane subunit [Planctomycetes bacterium]|nr:efflux transporter outer membrane subunit [Planctomycetota bacterium]